MTQKTVLTFIFAVIAINCAILLWPLQATVYWNEPETMPAIFRSVSQGEFKYDSAELNGIPLQISGILVSQTLQEALRECSRFSGNSPIRMGQGFGFVQTEKNGETTVWMGYADSLLTTIVKIQYQTVEFGKLDEDAMVWKTEANGKKNQVMVFPSDSTAKIWIKEQECRFEKGRILGETLRGFYCSDKEGKVAVAVEEN